MRQAGQLVDMDMRSFTFKTEDGEHREGRSIVWTWELDDGMRVTSECDPTLSVRPENRFRQWAEALLGVAIGDGDTVDSRDLIGRRALLELEVHSSGLIVSVVAPEAGGAG